MMTSSTLAADITPSMMAEFWNFADPLNDADVSFMSYGVHPTVAKAPAVQAPAAAALAPASALTVAAAKPGAPAKAKPAAKPPPAAAAAGAAVAAAPPKGRLLLAQPT
jgi:hypothetical protein